MPVRSSVCTYSPASISASSKHSSVSSLSIGHYKPLASSASYNQFQSTLANRYNTVAPAPSTLSPYRAHLTTSGSGRPSGSIYHSPTSNYTPSSANSSKTTTSALYRPLSTSVATSHSNTTNSVRQSVSPSSRYSSSSSSGTSSISSLTSNDYYPYSSPASSYNRHQYQASTSPSLRRLSYTNNNTNPFPRVDNNINHLTPTNNQNNKSNNIASLGRLGTRIGGICCCCCWSSSSSGSPSSESPPTSIPQQQPHNSSHPATPTSFTNPSTFDNSSNDTQIISANRSTTNTTQINQSRDSTRTKQNKQIAQQTNSKLGTIWSAITRSGSSSLLSSIKWSPSNAPSKTSPKLHLPLQSPSIPTLPTTLKRDDGYYDYHDDFVDNNTDHVNIHMLQSQQSFSDGSTHSSASQMMVYPSPTRPSSVLYSPSPSGSSASSGCSLNNQSSESLPGEVPRGLINLGNTCYMNSVLQSLYSIKPFNHLIESSYTSKALTSNLSDLFKTMKRSSAQGGSSQAPVSAASFKQTFSRYQSKFSGLNQQDAQEFLRYLINGCHDEMNQARGVSRFGGSSGAASRQAPKTAGEAWSQYRDIVDNSPLVDMLVGQLCSTITCSICQNQSHCWDPFWDLSLALSSQYRQHRSYQASCRLADLIALFMASETLDGDERPVCEKCSKPTRSSKQISFTRLPKVLILHLKKFSNDGYKLSSPEVKCEDNLELSSHRYFLVAAISHHGHSASSGHYTAHCKYSHRWFHFNDDRVRDVTNSFDCSKLDDAYVLFYSQDSSYSPNNNRKQSSSISTSSLPTGSTVVSAKL